MLVPLWGMAGVVRFGRVVWGGGVIVDALEGGLLFYLLRWCGQKGSKEMSMSASRDR